MIGMRNITMSTIQFILLNLIFFVRTKYVEIWPMACIFLFDPFLVFFLSKSICIKIFLQMIFLGDKDNYLLHFLLKHHNLLLVPVRLEKTILGENFQESKINYSPNHSKIDNCWNKWNVYNVFSP